MKTIKTMKQKKANMTVKFLSVAILVGIFIVPVLVFNSYPAGIAQGAGMNVSGKLENPLGNNKDVFQVVSLMLDFVLTIASIFAVVFFIYLGFQYVMARGNPGEISKLHGTFLSGVVGVAIIFSAKLISMIIQNTINAVK